MGWLSWALKPAFVAWRKPPGVKSIGPASMRVKGSVTLCSGVTRSLHLLYSLPRTPSRVRLFGYARSRPVGFMAPWKSTVRWCSAAFLTTVSYQLTIHWSSRAMKSTLMPATPHFS